MNIESVKQYLFEQKKNYKLLGINEIGLLLNYEDYKQICYENRLYEWNAQSVQPHVNGCLITWSDLVKKDEIKVFIV